MRIYVSINKTIRAIELADTMKATCILHFLTVRIICDQLYMEKLVETVWKLRQTTEQPFKQTVTCWSKLLPKWRIIICYNLKEKKKKWFSKNLNSMIKSWRKKIGRNRWQILKIHEHVFVVLLSIISSIISGNFY